MLTPAREEFKVLSLNWLPTLQKIPGRQANDTCSFIKREPSLGPVASCSQPVSPPLQQRAFLSLTPAESYAYMVIKNLLCLGTSLVVKNLPANAGDMDSSPGLGRSHMPRSS